MAIGYDFVCLAQQSNAFISLAVKMVCLPVPNLLLFYLRWIFPVGGYFLYVAFILWVAFFQWVSFSCGWIFSLGGFFPVGFFFLRVDFFCVAFFLLVDFFCVFSNNSSPLEMVSVCFPYLETYKSSICC